MNLFITGAAGNLGGMLASHIVAENAPAKLILMEHRTPVSKALRNNPEIEIRKGDLARPETLKGCLHGVDTIVHFAGVLFKAGPEKFLPTTNTLYFKNLVDAAKAEGIRKVILISFPHVEGPTTKASPATGHLDGSPESVHAQTRLAEEKYLFREMETPISLRAGMVYGRGILMIDAARWCAARSLLGVWRDPTPIHLISRTDFCRAVVAAATNKEAKGIYHVGDEGDDTLQSFLDLSCDLWGMHRPWRMPIWMIYTAAAACEGFSRLFGTRSPLTRDFITIGRVGYHGDTRRFRAELLPELVHPTVDSGRELLKTGPPPAAQTA
ncbi:NAD-dependent epimerase/dehydratase family protein [Desulfoluna spongiiphila]|uniref:Nucleoside-diphosphate-sugar epimerase n=1 Tax=Desulfoluna spongiiphila TaxID=419481 RepID=A0A1G5H2B4_9BACT|nr:NAD-dependent epimerase/dehydratase family protein [Desulfoluna spongiiphila]SCY57058.1 Nucleoside-diphosphate-sugar epimerase [Desulfoluna spongiiphila]